MSRLAIGRKSCTCSAARKATAFSSLSAVSTSASTTRGGAVRHQRAVGALERAGDERIFLALGTAKFEAQILAHLRVRITDAVLVVLGGDHSQRVGLVAPFLEIESGNLAKNSGKAAVDFGLLAHIGCLEQVAPDLGPGRRRHLLDADHSTMRAERASIDLMP